MKRQGPQQNKQHKELNIQLKEDRLLWRALKLGDTIALKELFNKYYSDLFFYGSKLASSRNKSADTIQDLFANIWENRKSIADVVYVKAYLFTALRNNILKADPKDIFDKSESVNNLLHEYDFDISPEEIYLDNETQLENRRIIEVLLEELSPKQKEIIYLKFYGNYSNNEISEILSIEKQSVANLLARTIKTLKKKRKGHNFLIYNLLLSHLL